MAGDDLPSKHSKKGGQNQSKYGEDPLADLFQLEKDRLPIDEEDVVIINKLFNDVHDFYKLKENIRVVLKENYMNEQEIESFFIRLIRRNSLSKYTLGKKAGYSNNRTLWKFIFDLPEMIRGRAVRIKSYRHNIWNILV